MLIFSLIFFGVALFTFIIHAGHGNSFDDNNQLIRLILNFIASGLFLGLYRIIDLLEQK